MLEQYFTLENEHRTNLTAFIKDVFAFHDKLDENTIIGYKEYYNGDTTYIDVINATRDVLLMFLNESEYQYENYELFPKLNFDFHTFVLIGYSKEDKAFLFSDSEDEHSEIHVYNLNTILNKLNDGEINIYELSDCIRRYMKRLPEITEKFNIIKSIDIEF